MVCVVCGTVSEPLINSSELQGMVDSCGRLIIYYYFILMLGACNCTLEFFKLQLAWIVGWCSY